MAFEQGLEQESGVAPVTGIVEPKWLNVLQVEALEPAMMNRKNW